MKNSKLRLVVPALALFSLTACATVVSVPRTRPAEINLAGYKRVAIGGIRGKGGDELVKDLTQALFETKRYEVLDRQHLAEILKEQDLGASGAISDETAASIGNLIGSAALLVGDVTNYDYSETVTQKQKKCRKGKQEYACTHYTRTGRATVSASLKVVDTESGKLLAVKNLTASSGTSKTEIDKTPAPFGNQEAWFASSRKKVVADFMKVIAPYKVTVRLKLLDDGDLPELETGNNWAKMGRWTEAIAQYNAAIQTADSDPDVSAETRAKAHYNLGVGLGYSGQYDAGIAALEKAYSLNPEPEYIGQVKVIEGFKADDAKLAEQKAGDRDDGV